MSSSPTSALATEKIVECIYRTLHHGEVARDYIRQANEHAKYLVRPPSVDSETKRKGKSLSDLSEIEIAMDYGIQSAINQLECCGRILTKLCLEGSISMTPNSNSFSLKLNFLSNQTMNGSTHTSLELCPSEEDCIYSLDSLKESNATSCVHSKNYTGTRNLPLLSPDRGSVIKSTSRTVLVEEENPEFEIPHVDTYDSQNSLDSLKPISKTED